MCLCHFLFLKIVSAHYTLLFISVVELSGPETDNKADEEFEDSFVFKSNKIKDVCLLSGFCMECAVPLEEGKNVETMGVIVGRSIGRNVQMTHVIIDQ